MLTLLKKLQHLAPDEAYSRRSRQAILTALPTVERPRSVWQVLMHSVQFGSAVALAGLLMVLVLGGFSTWRFLSPFRLSSLDPADLRAEAQAIDVQLEVANITYSEPPAGPATAAAMVEPENKNEEVKKLAQTEAEELGLKPATSSAAELTVDEALLKLAE